jgi:putative oxidoreductase
MQRYGPTALRLAVGAVFVAHGAQKLFGIWGGPGLARTASFFASLGLSPAYPLAVTVAGLEFAGGLLLILGGATFWVSLALAAEMAVAAWKVHYQNGFFLNWNGTPGRGHGIEFSLVLIGALLALALGGAGALSLDERRHSDREARARGRARIRKV